MTDDEKEKAAWQRHRDASHAMQSGVAYEMNIPACHGATTPKHLRTGVNAALVDNGSLVDLLVRKGFITSLEVAEAMAAGMEAEVKRYEARIAEHVGAEIKLR